MNDASIIASEINVTLKLSDKLGEKNCARIYSGYGGVAKVNIIALT